MASNAKWRERLVAALAGGDLTYWNNNKGFLSPSDQLVLEEQYLPKPEPKVVAPKAAPKAAPKKTVAKKAAPKAPKASKKTKK